jgi:integrase/recombinase XerC
MEPTVSAILSKYLDWCLRHRSLRTHQWYAGHLRSFLAHGGESVASLPACQLRPYHVVEWVDAQSDWGNTYSRGAISAVQRAFNWAEELGYIELSRIKRIRKPPAGRRENPMTLEDYQALLSHLPDGDPFRDLLVFVWHTGCRPQEVRHIEPRHVQLDHGRIVFPKAEAKGKQRARVIYLSGPSLAIIERLMKKRRQGKLFRNNRGWPWQRHALCNRMERLSKLIAKPLAIYDARHGFATRKLVQGHDHLTIAELMGHTDGTMLAKIYQHLDRNPEHLRKALDD